MTLIYDPKGGIATRFTTANGLAQRPGKCRPRGSNCQANRGQECRGMVLAQASRRQCEPGVTARAHSASSHCSTLVVQACHRPSTSRGRARGKQGESRGRGLPLLSPCSPPAFPLLSPCFRLACTWLASGLVKCCLTSATRGWTLRCRGPGEGLTASDKLCPKVL